MFHQICSLKSNKQDCSINSVVPTGVRVNTFRTIIQMTFTTFCRSVLLTAQCTYINLLPNNLKIKEISSRAGRSITIPYQYIGGGDRSQRTNPYNIPQHINGHADLENVSHVLWVPKVHKPHPTNGANRQGIRKVCHKIWEVGTMVETIQLVRPPNFLNNIIQKIPYTGHTQGATPKRGSPSPQPEGPPTWRSELQTGYPQ